MARAVARAMAMANSRARARPRARARAGARAVGALQWRLELRLELCSFVTCLTHAIFKVDLHAMRPGSSVDLQGLHLERWPMQKLH